MSALWMEVVIEFPELFYIQQVDLMKQTQENQFYEQLEDEPQYVDCLNLEQRLNLMKKIIVYFSNELKKDKELAAGQSEHKRYAMLSLKHADRDPATGPSPRKQPSKPTPPAERRQIHLVYHFYDSDGEEAHGESLSPTLVYLARHPAKEYLEGKREFQLRDIQAEKVWEYIEHVEGMPADVGGWISYTDKGERQREITTNRQLASALSLDKKDQVPFYELHVFEGLAPTNVAHTPW